MKRRTQIISLFLASTLFASNLQAAPRSAKTTKPAARVSAAQKSLNEQLMAAAYRNDFAKIKSLISRGAQINAQNYRGDSAFTVAVSKGNLPIVEYMIAKGGNVKKGDDTGFTHPWV